MAEGIGEVSWPVIYSMVGYFSRNSPNALTTGGEVAGSKIRHDWLKSGSFAVGQARRHCRNTAKVKHHAAFLVAIRIRGVDDMQYQVGLDYLFKCHPECGNQLMG